ncbi:MAG TPA: hypothetical protein VM582_06915 [Candidatus Thermoplasmatota archaeon]|nr:hypothetical protein [Candidatus Thermoplasmatota archaeon]
MRTPLLLLALALVAPAALAQVPVVNPQLAVFASDPGRAFVPGATEMVAVTVTYGPGQGGRPAPAPTPDRPEDVQPTRIVLAAQAVPSWVTSVRFEPAELLVRIQVENGTRSVTLTVPAYLEVSPEAPALVREDFIVTATAEPNGNIRGATAVSPELKLRATTLGILNVTAEPRVVVPGGRWTDVDFTVRNDGNSEILAKINVTVRPENSQVQFSDTLQLARGESKVVPVRVRTPWTNAEFGSLELEATPIVEGEPGTPARAEVDVVGQSAVPAAPALGALTAAAAALLRRRR